MGTFEEPPMEDGTPVDTPQDIKILPTPAQARRIARVLITARPQISESTFEVEEFVAPR